MNLLDHHMHSRVSFDSKVDLEAYLRLSDNDIITTEHLDFRDPSGNFVDRIPDYEAHIAWAKTLNEVYDNRVYVGIEIGWTQDSHDEILEFIKGKDYALTLLSVHQNGHADYLEKDKFKHLDKGEMITVYLETLKAALTSMAPYVDIMTHFDYGFRVHDVSVDDLELYGKELLTDIFKMIIEHDIAFELNTSSMYKHGKLHLYTWAIHLYQSLGGSAFVLGSDAHFSSDYQRNFSDAVEYIKGFGVTEVLQLFSEYKGYVKI